jgi:hypothetical protein
MIALVTAASPTSKATRAITASKDKYGASLDHRAKRCAATLALPLLDLLTCAS